MKVEYIEKILISHSVPYFVKDGHIFADSMMSGTELFEVVEDLTALTKKQLYELLGYQGGVFALSDVNGGKKWFIQN